VKIISVFNNKGGVGKTTLTYHLAHILAEMGKKILILDLDPQCNISLYGMNEEDLEKIWRAEENIIDKGFDSARRQMKDKDFDALFNSPRTIHFLLKSVEEGISDFEQLPPPFQIADNLDLIPGRLTLFMYENKISERWTGMFLGEPLSIRTVMKIRKLSELYSERKGYDFVITDTSPSLGTLNKVIISTADGFIIPCLPDMFSLYGIKNIGKALTQWQRDFSVCRSILSPEKRKGFPNKYVSFLGYTIYNAEKRSGSRNKWKLTQAHYSYAQQIQKFIQKYIPEEVRNRLSKEMLNTPIGVLHSHGILSDMVQRYRKPIWSLPDDAGGNCQIYKDTRATYEAFADDFLKRVATLDE